MIVDTNGNWFEEYPTQYRQATRIGINFRGWVEYANSERGIIYEAVYGVKDTSRFSDLRQHNMLGSTILEHVKSSQRRFGTWRHVEI
jgi:hypothetical protein